MSGLRGAPVPILLAPRGPRDRRPAPGFQPLVSIALAAAALLVPASVGAQTALSVDHNALWRVDLKSRAAQVVVDLDSASPFFACGQLTASSTGLVRCAVGDALFAIDAGSGEISELATLPMGPFGGLAFDGADRLWYLPWNGSDLFRLDPATGLVVHSLPVSLVGAEHYALAAFGERLFTVTTPDFPSLALLEEIDPATGASLSAAELPSVRAPGDAAFDERGDLWVAEHTGEIILGVHCFQTSRIVLAPLEVDPIWSECVFLNSTPVFTNIADLRGPSALEIPTVGRPGIAALIALLVLGALLILRRSA